MRRLAVFAVLPLALSTPVLAQPADPHAGHHPPPRAATSDAPATDPHAGHAAPTSPAVDPHAGHNMTVTAAPPEGGDPVPPIPVDHDADRFYPSAAMAAARDQLAREHGAISWSKVAIEKLELRPDSGANAYSWEGRASFGGDINRLVFKSRGDGDGELDEAEVELLYSHAITPHFNLEAGLRQDFEPRARTYLALGVDGVTPYGFELDSAIFLSDNGDITARAEVAHDLRLTQRLILEPRVEANLAAQNSPEQRIGSGLSSVEFGLRLRYALRPEFAPYIGVNYERRFGDTARLARAAREDRAETRLVVGVRSWF